MIRGLKLRRVADLLDQIPRVEAVIRIAISCAGLPLRWRMRSAVSSVEVERHALTGSILRPHPRFVRFGNLLRTIRRFCLKESE
jgi:hypothetical protein